MTNIKARNTSGDDWKTPDEFYNELNKVYHFDFDPCPYQSSFDGLDPATKWGGVNFINPPYSLKLKTAFVKRALEESKTGKTCVLLLPVSTSTELFHNVILPNAKKIEFVKGRLRFEQKDADGVFRAHGVGQHDSMIVVF